MFETATYTDCLATESFDGAAGFNFASVSPGYDGTSRAVALSRLLHKVSSTWGLEHEATTQPESAHFHPEGGRYHFSRGRSTGATASGRRGNQFTQLAVTDSAADLAPYRPAQVLRATAWMVEPPTVTQAPTWEAPLDVAPEFEADALLDWARREPRVAALVAPVLTQLAAAAQPTSAERLVVVGSDSEACLRLVALATLLMDEVTANGLGIALGVEDPWQAGEPIVIVPRQFERSDGLVGSWFVDMDQLSCPPLEASPLARATARWLGEMDDYDLLELVGLARSWARHVDEDLAARSAALVTGHADEVSSEERRRLGIALMTDMARAGAVDELVTWDEELRATIDDWPHGTEQDFVDRAQAAASAQAAGLGTMAGHITDATLELMTLDQTHAGAWARVLLAADGWSWPDPPEGANFIHPVLQVAARLDGDDLVDFGRLVARMPQPPVIESQVLQKLTDLAALEVDRFKEVATWWQGPQVQQAVVTRLVAALDQDQVIQRRELASGRLDDLARTAFRAGMQDAEVLMKWVHAAQLSRLDPKERAARLSRVRLPGRMWQVALGGVPVLDDPTSWASWLRQHPPKTTNSPDPVGVDAATKLETVLKTASAGDLKHLEPLATALQERGYADTFELYRKAREERPRMVERIFRRGSDDQTADRESKER